MKQIHFVALQPNLKDIVVRSCVLVDFGLRVDGVAKLLLHARGDLFGNVQVGFEIAAGNNQVPPEILLEVVVLGTGIVDGSSHHVSVGNAVSLQFVVLSVFVLPSRNVFLGIVPGRQVGMFWHFEIVREDVVFVLDVLVVKIFLVPLAVVYIQHPFFHGRHLDLLLVGIFERDQSGFRGSLLGNFFVTEPKIIPLQLFHVGIVHIVPSKVKVAISCVLVPFTDHELGIPVLQDDGGFWVVLDGGQNKIRHVEGHVVFQPREDIVTGRFDLNGRLLHIVMVLLGIRGIIEIELGRGNLVPRLLFQRIVNVFPGLIQGFHLLVGDARAGNVGSVGTDVGLIVDQSHRSLQFFFNVHAFQLLFVEGEFFHAGFVGDRVVEQLGQVLHGIQLVFDFVVRLVLVRGGTDLGSRCLPLGGVFLHLF
mmetsp:Transcript_6772/g.16940  ORF Transcript_6772/g.16940 Transcript_6772/m.16940 type:complete len:420 (-) Transcript_6772:1151-2410(-)